MATSGEWHLLLVFLVLFLLPILRLYTYNKDNYFPTLFWMTASAWLKSWNEKFWKLVAFSDRTKVGINRYYTSDNFQASNMAGSLQLYLKLCHQNFLIKTYLFYKHLCMAATDKVFSLTESQRFSLKTLLFLITIFYPSSFKNSSFLVLFWS